MTQENMSPLRSRMIEDMRIRGMAETSQKAHIRALKDFAAFLGRSPDTATPDELRANLLEADKDVWVIQVLLGHVKLTTTARYRHVATKTLRNVASPFEQIRGVTRRIGRRANAGHLSLSKLKVMSYIEAPKDF